MIALILTLILIAQAISDSFAYFDKKRAQKVTECIVVALFLTTIYFTTPGDFRYLIGYYLVYLFYRLAIYDVVINLSHKFPINYVGTTSPVYDDFMKRLKGWEFWAFRIWFMILTIFIYIKVLRHEK
jgi:hypothetical protein